MTRTKLIDILETYLAGRKMSLREYVAQKDAPILVRTIKRVFGSWSSAVRFVEARKKLASLKEDNGKNVENPKPLQSK